MIKRSGFVSNSSSSSFIVGIGALPKDIDSNTLTFLNTVCSSEYTVMMKTKAELIEDAQTGYSIISIEGHRVQITGGGNSDPMVEIEWDDDQDTKYLVVEINNDEGDDQFYNGCDLDYDIDEEYYSKNQQRILQILKSLPKSDYKFGAERHG